MTEAYAPTELDPGGQIVNPISIEVDPQADAETEMSFFDAVAVIAQAHISQHLPFPTGIYQNHPGTGYLVIHFATAEDAAAWRKFFGFRGHRSEPSFWVWGWFGWTVELGVSPYPAAPIPA